jgi:hypothetical protein
LNAEEQNTGIRKKLLKLPRMKASPEFENNLLRMINTLGPETAIKEPDIRKPGILDFLFGKKALIWAVPAGSLAVILIIFFLIVRNDSIKETADIQNGKTPVTSSDDEQRNTVNSQPESKSEIPGKDLANDLEIGRTTPAEKEKHMQKGFQESMPEFKTEKSAPQTGKEKAEINDVKEEVKTNDAVRSEDAKKNEVKEMPPPKPQEKGIIEEAKTRKEEGYDALRKEEKVKEESEKAPSTDKKIIAPLIPESDKKKTGKDSTKKDESKNKKKELSKELLEELKKKIKED